MQRTLLALVILLGPALTNAQGRLFARPCAPPPCPPDAICERPLPMPAAVRCNGRIERVSSMVQVQLVDRVLRYEVTEIFRNAGGAVAEADYVFPLPAGAAFEDLKLSINGELVSGETMNADKARGIYEDIVRKMRDPALVEWMGSGLLRARIFPIAPGEEKTVVVRFQSVAVREGDALRIDYRRGSDALSSRFTLRYQHTDAFGDPSSPTHTLRVASEGRTHIVEARGSGSDVSVLIPLRRADEASMSVLTHRVGNDPGFAMITVTPPSNAAARPTPRDLTFVVDVSGSMQGRKLEQAKAAGITLLETLRPVDRFRLIDFSTDVRSFRSDWSTATADNVRAAKRYLEALRAEGSTNISEALTTALQTTARNDGWRTEHRMPLVVFVTDGEPTVGERNPDAIAALAARLRGQARVFTVGVGTGVNAALVEQLALQGRGTAHFVRDDESVEASVSLLARRLASPVLTDVRIVSSGVRLTSLLPAGPIDVFAGQDLVVLARYDGSGDATVRLEGQSPTGPITWSTRAHFVDQDRSNPFVARLWAAQRIGWLAAEKRRSGSTRELDDEIRSLGEHFGIPTEFSSYLVVEPGMSTASGNTRRALANSGAPSLAPTSAPLARADAQFEAARSSAKQRDAKSVSALDDMGTAAQATRGVGNRRFALTNGVWTDARYVTTMRTIVVRPYSAMYFALMRRLPELQEAFALGDRVVVAGRAVALLLKTDGVERVDDAQLNTIVRDW